MRSRESRPRSRKLTGRQIAGLATVMSIPLLAPTGTTEADVHVRKPAVESTRHPKAAIQAKVGNLAIASTRHEVASDATEEKRQISDAAVQIKSLYDSHRAPESNFSDSDFRTRTFVSIFPTKGGRRVFRISLPEPDAPTEDFTNISLTEYGGSDNQVVRSLSATTKHDGFEVITSFLPDQPGQGMSFGEVANDIIHAAQDQEPINQ